LLTACAPKAIAGTVVEPMAAPEFSLRDIEGREFSSRDLPGQVTLVTFLYSQCGDACPLMALKLRETADQLEKARLKATIVVISVDPVGDTPENVRKFSVSRDMTGRWTYLIGDRGALAPVWAGYAIGVGAAGAANSHTEAIWIHDKQGMRRVLLRGDFDPADLVEHVRRLS
jgi:protein SCO1/2